jgi:hypothetical protein
MDSASGIEITATLSIHLKIAADVSHTACRGAMVLTFAFCCVRLEFLTIVVWLAAQAAFY